MDETVTPEEVWRLFKATDEKLDRVIAEGDRRYAEFLEAMERSRVRMDAQFDRVAQQFAEIRAQFAEDRVRIAETWKQIAEDREQMAQTWKQIAENREQIAENNKLSANNERLIAELSRETTELSRETTELSRETTELSRETADLTRKMGDLTRKMGDLTDRLGEFAEAMVIPALRSLFAKRGIIVHRVYRHVEVSYDGKAAEFDVVMVNGPYVAAVEIKSRLKVGHVTEHLERLRDFRQYLPEFRDRAVIGAVAGMVVDEDAAKFAYRQGLFVIGQGGETVTILNDDKFNPKEW